MTTEALLELLENVQPRGARWVARCPAHADRRPSLQISEGEKAILLKCWAGCSVDDICRALHLRTQDVFYDALDSDPHRRREAAKKRANERAARERILKAEALTIDAMKAAEDFIRSRAGIDISRWADATLNEELGALADAYRVLEGESQWTA